MFYGEYRHTMDDKGRLSLPAKFRSELGDRVVVTKGIDKCLYVYTLDGFEDLTRRLGDHASSERQFRDFRRRFLAGSVDTDVDGHGRILIQAGHREHAGLERDVVVIGVARRVEIWDAAAYDAYSEAASESFAAAAEKLADFGF